MRHVRRQRACARAELVAAVAHLALGIGGGGGDDDGIGGGGDAVAPAVSAESTESAGGEPKKEGGDQLPEGGATNANTAQGRGGTLLHPQCIDGSALMKEEEEEDRNRPLLILKYARTGST